MGTITIHFKNLCALFTKHLNNTPTSRLMAGLLDVKTLVGPDAMPHDVHYPRITIYPVDFQNVTKGKPVVYDGFSDAANPNALPEGAQVITNAIGGKIVFDAPHLAVGIKQPAPNGLGQILTPLADLGIVPPPNKNGEIQEAFSPFQFSKIPFDLESDLYPKATDVKPGLADNLPMTGIYFKTGSLFALDAQAPKFIDVATGLDAVTKPFTTGFSPKAMLRAQIKKTDYAVLRFLESDVPDYVFKGEKDYAVIIDNAPDLAHHMPGMTNHFQFYYRLLKQPPAKLIVPPNSSDGQAGDLFCFMGVMSKTNYLTKFPFPA